MSIVQPNSLIRFGLEVLAWLALMLFAWFGTGALVAGVLAQAVELLFDLLLPVSIKSVTQRGSDVMVTSAYLIGGADKQLLGMLHHPLEQGFGLALYFALTLVPPAPPVKLILKLLAGLLLTLGVLLWGVVFAVLDHLFVQAGLQPVEFSVSGPIAKMLIGLGNALGVLILPTVAPVVLWLALNWDYASSLVGRERMLDARGDQTKNDS